MDPLDMNAPAKQRVGFSILLFVLGFVLLASAIHLFLSDPIRLHADLRSEKLNILDGWKGGVYAAAFGSSHVNSGFDPRAFDDELTAMQRRTPSVNLGVAGGSQSEQRALAIEFLRHFSTGSTPEQQPCFLFLELNAGANFTADHLVHPRAINIYDWATTKFVLSLSDGSVSSMQRVGRGGYALIAMGLHYTNVGMLSSYILSPPINQQLLQDETENGRRGLQALVGELNYLPQPAIPSDAKTPVPVPKALTPGNYELLYELAAASNDPKLHLTYIVFPFYTDQDHFPLYPDSIQTPHGVEPILSIRPDIHPELFQPKYWHDDAHVNEEGAALASRLLAEQLQSWYIQHHRTTNCGG